ncbi:hypothetical protein RN001_009275 [Aquatica leii]|uniref:15-hydroxyprostaglandin dehydrogenase [NAD(+)]-like n=1 Tax=Aquatica leii TaxID=1421715 RepID=A0AAN7PTL1_9COLE|nr:hypothetical protein RN001_009275 [Aquatica leii]
MFVVEGKVVLVTGGASGIGLACVKEFLNNGIKGVTIADVNDELGLLVLDEIKKKFGDNKVLFVKTDVSDKNQFEDAFKKTIEKFNHLDVLVNNAGIFNERNWEKTIAVNFNGQVIGNLLGLETYIPKHKSSSLGVIINMCSIASVNIRGFNPVYTATKHATLGLSRSFGVKEHFDRTKVKVISVCPGPTKTDMEKDLDTLTLNENYAKLYDKIKNDALLQSTSHVAASIVNITKNAETGSVWVIENEEAAYELEFPTRQQMKKKNN